MTFRASCRRILPALVVIGLGLTGCTVQPDPNTDAEPGGYAAAAPTPADEAGIDCDEILSVDGSRSSPPTASSRSSPSSSIRSPSELEEAGGAACSWGKPRTDPVLTVVQLNVPDSDWEGWEAALAEADYVDATATGTYTGPVEPGAGVSPVAVVTGDRITFLSAPMFADLLAPHAI